MPVSFFSTVEYGNLFGAWEVMGLAERDAKGRFVAGNKAQGKSGGRPKLSLDERMRIKELGKKGLDKLEDMLDSNMTDDAVKARVAIFCVEKAYGKARQEIEHNSTEDTMPIIVVRRETDGGG